MATPLTISARQCSTPRRWCWRRLHALASARLMAWSQHHAVRIAERRAVKDARITRRARSRDLPQESAYHATMQELWRSGRPEERRR